MNLTRDKFERLLKETQGVENYNSTFVINGKTYKKKDFEMRVKRKSASSIFNCMFSRVHLPMDEVVTVYDQSRLEQLLQTE